MQVWEYVRIVRARWWLVLLALVCATAASYLWARTQTPLYRSTTSIVFVPARPDQGQMLAAQNMSRQAAAQIATERLLQAVDERGRFDLGVDALKAKVRASATLEQALLQIEVVDTDPERSRRLAMTVEQEYRDRHADRMANVDPRDRIDADLNDQARPGVQTWPQTRTTVLAGALMGLLAGIALTFAAEWLDDTYHTPDEVERGTGLTVLGAIPQVRET